MHPLKTRRFYHHAQCQIVSTPFHLFGLWANAVTVCSALALSWLLVGTAFAEITGPRMEIVPTELTLPAGNDPLPLTVVFRNKSAQAVSTVSLSWEAAGGLNVQARGQLKVSKLDADADMAWVLLVSRPVPKRVAPSLTLRADFIANVSGKSTAQVLLQAVPLKAALLETADALVDVKLLTTLDSLQTERKGQVYFEISNKSARALHLYDLHGIKNDVVSFDNPINLGQSVLAPQEELVAVANVTANKRIVPGKYLLIFRLEVGPEEEKNDPASRRILIKETNPVNLQVMGDSELTKLLGVPSFLFLPGYLMLIAFSLAWQFSPVQLQSPNLASFPEPSTPKFWVISLTLSGLMALTFRTFSGEWYFVRYGVNDLMLVWIVSVMVGLVGYWMFPLWYWWTVPLEKDLPIRVLRKLERQGLKLVVERVRPSADPTQGVGFVIQKRTEGSDTIRICSAIGVAAKNGAPQEVRNELNDKLNAGNPRELAKMLRKQKANFQVEWIEGRWKADALTGPRRVPTNSIEHVDEYPIVRTS